MNGWFKFHRKMLEHPVWNLSEGQFKVWMTCLALANHKPATWWDGKERVEIPAGSFVTSQPHLAEAAGTSRIVVRHALSNLEVLGSIRAKSRAKCWTLIEIVNWPLYQGGEDEASQEESPRRAKDEPSASHNGRMKECKKERKEPSPASGLTLPEYLEKLSPEDQEIIRQTVQAIACTRKSGKVTESVLDSLARKLNRYPSTIVLEACRIYLTKNYATEGKREQYLLGIVRGEAKRQKGNGRKPCSPFVGQKGEIPTPAGTPPELPYPSPTTEGQRAINRAWLDQQREQEQAR